MACAGGNGAEGAAACYLNWRDRLFCIQASTQSPLAVVTCENGRGGALRLAHGPSKDWAPFAHERHAEYEKCRSDLTPAPGLATILLQATSVEWASRKARKRASFCCKLRRSRVSFVTNAELPKVT